MSRKTRYIITTYALSTGVFVGRFQSSRIGGNRVFHPNTASSFVLGRDAFPVTDIEAATAAVERARTKRLASLRKQIDRLEALDPAAEVQKGLKNYEDKR